MKFRFIIIDAFDGCPVGTNDEKIAKEFASVDDNFVIDLGENGTNPEWMLDTINRQEVTEQTDYKLEG